EGESGSEGESASRRVTALGSRSAAVLGFAPRLVPPPVAELNPPPWSPTAVVLRVAVWSKSSRASVAILQSTVLPGWEQPLAGASDCIADRDGRTRRHGYGWRCGFGHVSHRCGHTRPLPRTSAFAARWRQELVVGRAGSDDPPPVVVHEHVVLATQQEAVGQIGATAVPQPLV